MGDKLGLGVKVGSCEAPSDGDMLGKAEGTALGNEEGRALGSALGSEEGKVLGVALGSTLGSADGRALGRGEVLVLFEEPRFAWPFSLGLSVAVAIVTSAASKFDTRSAASAITKSAET